MLHSLTLQTTSATPDAHCQIFSPNGDNIFTVKANVNQSIASAYFKIPDDQSGGT
jgi:hypothetical protein